MPATPTPPSVPFRIRTLWQTKPQDNHPLKGTRILTSLTDVWGEKRSGEQTSALAPEGLDLESRTLLLSTMQLTLNKFPNPSELHVTGAATTILLSKLLHE